MGDPDSVLLVASSLRLKATLWVGCHDYTTNGPLAGAVLSCILWLSLKSCDAGIRRWDDIPDGHSETKDDVHKQFLQDLHGY